MTTMTREQHRRLAEAPDTCKRAIADAYAGKASPRMAIKAFCLQCTGYSRREIECCTATACPVWWYRPFQRNAPKMEGRVRRDAEQNFKRERSA